MYESFIRGEEDEEEEDDEEVRVTVLEVAWVAARPSSNRELHVTIITAITIIMVIISIH